MNILKSLIVSGSVLLTFSNCNQQTAQNQDASKETSLAETPEKNTVKSDNTQADPNTFLKTLSLQGISFTIQSVKNDGKETLTITPKGLSIDNKSVTHDITGETILNAEIADMNHDGYPELLIYTQSHGSGSYGNIIGYSVNNGKSMSQITYPEVAENPKINAGYSGHDSFKLVNGILTQHFPIYKDGDTNAQPSGKTRQIEYELKDGEASRKLVVTKVSES